MKRYCIIVFTCLALVASAAFAEETAEGEGAAKPKPKPKAKAQTAISTVMNLPEVKAWGQWMKDDNGTALEVWGDTIKQVHDDKCWGVGVGETNGKEVHVWQRFCVQEYGLEIWVESVPVDKMDEITYYTYDQWRTQCKPTFNSHGKC